MRYIGSPSKALICTPVRRSTRPRVHAFEERRTPDRDRASTAAGFQHRDFHAQLVATRHFQAMKPPDDPALCLQAVRAQSWTSAMLRSGNNIGRSAPADSGTRARPPVASTNLS